MYFKDTKANTTTNISKSLQNFIESQLNIYFSSTSFLNCPSLLKVLSIDEQYILLGQYYQTYGKILPNGNNTDLVLYNDNGTVYTFSNAILPREKSLFKGNILL